MIHCENILNCEKEGYFKIIQKDRRLAHSVVRCWGTSPQERATHQLDDVNVAVGVPEGDGVDPGDRRGVAVVSDCAQSVFVWLNPLKPPPLPIVGPDGSRGNFSLNFHQ